ncbi:IS21 family transposase [Slackia exigua]|uniref:IS21 family transposase n=1 Tax=Slackia exigua TaxID=84109 RepID=UPI0028DD05FC|nr:IS21 family transposase [Slackia exigua]
MISMSDVHSIRQLRRSGESVTSIAKAVGVSRDTVYKYLRMDDLSPKMPQPAEPRPSKLDPYKPLIEQWLDDDERGWRKQRHTARRIWQRLVGECGLDVSEATVARYVKESRERRRTQRDQCLDLAWAPGEAQADFGEADFYLRGTRTRLSFFVVTFPYSNVGLAQLFPAENAECVCEGLRRVFEHVGGVPSRIVFDNAAGVGRRVGDAVRTTELFRACAAHYGFAYSFCNPRSGNEKGNVENKVGAIRRALFVPVPQVADVAAYNARLLGRCMALSDKPHWIKGEPESQPFVEDRFAMSGPPPMPFSCVRYASARADKQGKARFDGPHLYSADPALAGRDLVIAAGATELFVYDGDGALVCSHARAYGAAPTDTTDPASQLPLLCVKAGAWANSQVRAALSDGLRCHMDSLEMPDLKAELRMPRDATARTGWDATLRAAEAAYASCGRLDAASISVAAARAVGGSIGYDDPVDLGEYDRAVGMAG